MKRTVNFRLSNQATTILSLLSDSLELSKTEIVERALLRYFESNQSPISQFAGILNNDDADAMLKSILDVR